MCSYLKNGIEITAEISRVLQLISSKVGMAVEFFSTYQFEDSR
jgi:hypothetical protein